MNEIFFSYFKFGYERKEETKQNTEKSYDTQNEIKTQCNDSGIYSI